MSKMEKYLANLGEGVLNFTQADSEFDKIVADFAKKLQKSLSKSRPGRPGGHNASKNLYQSLGFNPNGGWEIKVLGQKASITLTLPDYYEYTDTGRNKTKRDGTGEVRKNLEGLKGWISQKGATLALPKSYTRRWVLKDGTKKEKKIPYKSRAEANKALAFFISRKIHKHGFKGTGWFSDEVEKFRKEAADKLSEILGTKVEFNITLLQNKK